MIKKETGRKISYKKAKSLISEFSGKRIDSLSKRFDSEIYLLSNDEVVVYSHYDNGPGRLWFSLFTLKSVLSNRRDEDTQMLAQLVQDPSHFMMEYDSFRSNTLSEIIDESEHTLDFSVSSLKGLDTLLNGNDGAIHFLENPMAFKSLLIYFIKTIENNGAGKILIIEESGSSYPCIMTSQGKLEKIFLHLYNELDNEYEEISLYNLFRSYR